MKKSVWIGIVVAVILIGAGVYFGTKKDDKVTSSSSTKSSSSSFKVVKACTAYPLTDAQALMGANAVAGGNTTGSSSTADIQVSTCGYTVPPTGTTGLGNILGSSLLVRAAKTQDGADSNAMQFKSGKPADAQTVEGYGDAAYWYPTLGQFNILKHNNWYILSYGTPKPATKTLDDAKKMADQINANL